MWGIYIFSRAEGHRQKSADFLGCSQILKSQCPSTFTIHYIYAVHITVSRETYYSVMQAYNLPILVSKETYYSTVSKETYYSVKKRVYAFVCLGKYR